MKFLLDQGLPRSTVLELQKINIESLHVGDIEMSAATDLEIINKAFDDDLIVVTLDADFHTILAKKRMQKPSVVRIRIEGLKSKELAGIINNALKAVHNELKNGAAISVTDKGIRVHNLPLV